MATYQMIHHVPTKINFIGFTLIEILFVIALIGVITAFSLSAYEKKSENTKIDKTALQIQQILQAATAYYNDNSCWPGNCSGSNIANFSDYLPFGENPKNPWGNAYHYQTLGPNGERFQVDTSVLTENIAKRVANKLPFSEVNDKTILTETVIPGATPENQSLIVKDIGSLTIRVEAKAIEKPGLFYIITRALIWENINIVEIVPTFTEMTFIFKEKDIPRAYSVLKQMIKSQ